MRHVRAQTLLARARFSAFRATAAAAASVSSESSLREEFLGLIFEFGLVVVSVSQCRGSGSGRKSTKLEPRAALTGAAA